MLDVLFAVAALIVSAVWIVVACVHVARHPETHSLGPRPEAPARPVQVRAPHRAA